MRLKVVAVSALSLVFGMLIAVAVFPNSIRGLLDQPKSWSVGKAQIGGPFQLIDHNENTVSDKTYAGKHLLVFFGFTYCPDICPAALQKVSLVMDKLGSKANNLKPLFISVDPERDTVAQLKLYMSNFDNRIAGLTGSTEQIADAVKVYRAYAKKRVDPSTSGGYTMDHSSFIYLMAPDGNFITHFTHVSPVDKMVERLTEAL